MGEGKFPQGYKDPIMIMMKALHGIEVASNKLCFGTTCSRHKVGSVSYSRVSSKSYIIPIKSFF